MISQHPHYGFELSKSLVIFVFWFLSELRALHSEFLITVCGFSSERDQSLPIHSAVHLSNIWTELLSLFFPAVNLCCNARKWWQWLVLRRDGFISSEMVTAS